MMKQYEEIKWPKPMDRSRIVSRETQRKEFIFSKVKNIEELKEFILSSVAILHLESAIYSFWYKTLLSKPKIHLGIEKLGIVHLAWTWHWYGMVNEGPHHVILPGFPAFTTDRMQTNIDVKIGNWFRALALARVFRDEGAQKAYNDVKYEGLQSRGGLSYDDYVGLEMEAHKAINNKSGEALSLIQKAITVMQNPAKVEKGHYAPAQKNEKPISMMWEANLTQNEEQFNEQLYLELTAWKENHTNDPADTNNIMAYLHLEALAACCYAHDHGINITVKSDYIPEFLIRGEFPKLKWPNPEWIK